MADLDLGGLVLGFSELVDFGWLVLGFGELAGWVDGEVFGFAGRADFSLRDLDVSDLAGGTFFGLVDLASSGLVG